MKKVIALNFLIGLLHFPYVVTRWMEMPYQAPYFWLEDIMVLGTMALGPLLTINTLLLILFCFSWCNLRSYALQLNILLLGLTFAYTIYAGCIISWDGTPVWVDIVACLLLYLGIRCARVELEVLKKRSETGQN